ALLGRADPERLARSNRAALDQLLEERFFARSKAIKREAAMRRLGALLDDGLGRGERAAAGRGGAVATPPGPGRADALLFQRASLAGEGLRLVAELDELWTAGAREVLDFVRPRRWAFGSNQAAPADRDFLLGLVEAELGALGERSRGRV